ncbi:ATP-dependent DNA helicase PIF1 [Ceratobasidium sp. AG-Ba]|nr:ATP-dependent DNA helicase PIF1 [Ceratobasidium sp. AG-Ba]QRW03413.1 ATP-dependent DNA helicase PIF1 [Ceratobasidium sp. AG-Ba]
MVDARWFDVLNEIGKTLRNSTRPFGGIQLVVCGDFFQLPPVPEQAYSDVGIPVSFAFEARCWDEAVPNTITLTKVFRQKQSELVDMLNDMRLGVVSQVSADLFSRLSRKVEYNDGIQPTQIYPLRRSADDANKRQMDLLTGEEIKFKALDTFGKDLYGEPITPQKGKSLLDKKVSDAIQLKVGAQVMCIQNLPDCGIVNGSIGVITRFVTPGEAHSTPEVQVAKSTLDRKWKVGDAALPSDPSQWDTQKWPVVRYQNGRMVVMTPFPFSHENADGGVEAIRQQVPLILAWALTVHKAQGQTLERVRVDLEGTFEKGQGGPLSNSVGSIIDKLRFRRPVPQEKQTPGIKLSTEQERILEMVLSGKSVFFTGPAGTGKSVLLRAIIEELRKQKGYESVAVTASTGIAAMNIKGTTLHSFAGVGLGNQHAYRLLEMAKGNRIIRRWRNTEVLIIDEGRRFLDSGWFDVLNEIGKFTRANKEPFGGIQLPPVPPQPYSDARVPVSFAFEATCWEAAVPNTIALTQVFRQREPELVNLLNDMRVGIVSESSAKLLYGLARKRNYTDGVHPTEIFPLRRLADASNKRHMDLLAGQSKIFRSTDELGRDIYNYPITYQRGQLLLEKMIPQEIELKVGAQVMCLQNFPDSGIINGSVGRITRFAYPAEARASEFLIPMPNVDPKWKPGCEAESSHISLWEHEEWPVVEFLNGAIVLMVPHLFEHTNAEGGMEATRFQVPLSLAWALTV